MIDLLSPTLTRVKELVPALKDVEGAAELAALLDKKLLPQRLPAAFVTPGPARAKPNEVGTLVTRQDVAETVGVVLVHKVAGDAKGAKTTLELMALRGAVLDALVGWQPNGDADPFQLVSITPDAAMGAVFLEIEVASAWRLRK